MGEKTTRNDPLLSTGTGKDDVPVDVFEVAGVIKWFDVAKGYGFIIPDNGMADVLLHVTCLRRDGYQTAYEGARVVCEAVVGERGYQVFRILSMDESTALHPAQMPPTRQRSAVKATACSRSTTAIGASMISNTRSAPAIAVWSEL